MSPRAAQVRIYVDADVPGLGKILAGLRSDVTYPGDPGAVIHRRERAPCPAAVAVLEFGQQPVHHVLAGKTGLPSGEARRDLRHQVIEQVLVIVMAYAGTSGCRICLSANWHDHSRRACFPASSATCYLRAGPT